MEGELLPILANWPSPSRVSEEALDCDILFNGLVLSLWGKNAKSDLADATGGAEDSGLKAAGLVCRGGALRNGKERG